MGHINLQLFPRSRAWLRVVALLESGASAATIAAASSAAAKAAFKNAADDPLFAQAFWILLNAPIAARGPDYVADLAALGIHVDADVSLLELNSAINLALDQRGFEVGGRTHFGEFAQLALVEALTEAVAPQLPSLFEPSDHETRAALGKLSSGDRFGKLARDFFRRLLHRSLDSFLSRELANHIGTNKRFATDLDRREFDNAFEMHCRETSRIVEAFASGWYGRHVWKEGGFKRADADKFAKYAFKKLRDELERRDAA